MSEKTIVKSVIGRIFNAKLLEEDLLYVQIDGESIFEIEDMKELLSAAKQLAAGSKVYNLCDLDSRMQPSDEAIDYAISDDGTAYSLAHAFVVRSVAQRVTGNLMIRFEKPKVPIKLFNSVESAMNWIRILKSEKT